jgi:hypothetical protein
MLVTYDEHGGFFDHVVPPKAVPPDANTQEYSFDQLGLRVPALLVSPWVKRGVESTQFDHTSLLKYLIEKWDLGPLGRRTAAAASIAVAIESAQPMHENTIARITLSVEQLVPPDPVKEEQSAESDSPHQLALQAMVRYFDIKRLFLTGVEVDLPVGLAFVARIIERIKYFFSRHADHSSVIVSPSQPDHISGKQGRQAKAHKDFTTVFRKQKMRSLSVLAQKVRCDDQTQREHAMRALSSLTGRKFHHEADLNKNIDRADEWLRRHKH